MKPQSIRRIDLWLGRPICLALTLLRRVGQVLLPRASEPPPLRKILLIKMIEQGATVLAYRAIERAVQLVGRQNVYFWVFDKNRAILDVLGLIPKENVLALRADRPISFAVDIVRTLWKVRRIGIDATVDMEFFARAPAILAFLSGARRRVGLHRFTTEGPYRGDLLTHRVQYNPYLHTAAGYYVLVEALLEDPQQTPLLKHRAPQIDFSPEPFRPTEAETSEVRQIIRRLADGRVGTPLVLLNPNASDLLPLRRWPTERFIELGKRLLRDEPEALIGITGAPSERAAAQEVAQAIAPDRAICLAGETTLRQLIVTYMLADVLVTNDSGPGHFASLTSLPTLVLFGPETPALYSPLGAQTYVMTANLSCSPCVNAMNHRFSPCDNNVCMQEISVDAVHERVSELLHPQRAPRRPLELMMNVRTRGARRAADGVGAPVAEGDPLGLERGAP